MGRIDEIKTRLAKATQGKWVFDKRRDTHDCCIYVEGSVEEDGCIIDGGVVGSSEWTWISDDDGDFIANSKQDIEFLLSEIERLKQCAT